MDDEMAEGLKQAIENGVGFIHTGGLGVFMAAGLWSVIEARPLAEVFRLKYTIATMSSMAGLQTLTILN